LTLDEYYTVLEVAAALRVDERTVRSWIDTKKIEGVKIGRHYRISKDALDRALNSP